MINADSRKRIAAANQLAEPIAYALTKAITGWDLINRMQLIPIPWDEELKSLQRKGELVMWAGRGNELPPKAKHLATIKSYWKSGNKTGKARESGERIRENILLAIGRYLHNSTLWHKGNPNGIKLDICSFRLNQLADLS